MAPLVELLRGKRARILVEDAGRLLGWPVLTTTLRDDPHTVAAPGGAGLIVHDFLPDVEASLRWLDLVAFQSSAIAVFALLAPPLSPVAHAVIRAPRGFHLAGMAATTEVDARWLAAAFRDLERVRVGRALLDGLTDVLGGDPVLVRLAERELVSARHHRTLEGLLHDCGVSRRRFVRHAHAAGFDPPLRFLHLLRVVKGTSLLQEGRTVREVMERLGYGSEATFRHHFREVMGRTPSEAARLASDGTLEGGAVAPN